MNTNTIKIVMLSAILTSTASADIFKCVVDGKTSYQPSPCASEKGETALPIKTTDPDANLKGEMARKQFELMEAERKLMEAEAIEERARAAAMLQRSQSAAESAERASQLRQQQIENEREQSEAWEKYLYKEGGMSPTFKR